MPTVVTRPHIPLARGPIPMMPSASGVPFKSQPLPYHELKPEATAFVFPQVGKKVSPCELSATRPDELRRARSIPPPAPGTGSVLSRSSKKRFDNNNQNDSVVSRSRSSSHNRARLPTITHQPTTHHSTSTESVVAAPKASSSSARSSKGHHHHRRRPPTATSTNADAKMRSLEQELKTTKQCTQLASEELRKLRERQHDILEALLPEEKEELYRLLSDREASALSAGGADNDLVDDMCDHVEIVNTWLEGLEKEREQAQT
eukprot:PhM_4_TR1728/c0_g1_i1/m.30616